MTHIIVRPPSCFFCVIEAKAKKVSGVNVYYWCSKVELKACHIEGKT